MRGRAWKDERNRAGAGTGQAVLALWEQGSIKPHIDRTYPFTEAAAAHRRILQRKNIGKVLLKP